MLNSVLRICSTGFTVPVATVSTATCVDWSPTNVPVNRVVTAEYVVTLTTHTCVSVSLGTLVSIAR